MDIFGFLFVFGLSFFKVAWSDGIENAEYFNVLDYGAVSDGVTDDSLAFLKAWAAACISDSGTPIIIIPKDHTFLLNPVTFNGPCVAEKIYVRILGKIVAPNSPKAWDGLDANQWLAFNGLNYINVYGSGKIDGQGMAWWNQSCRYHPKLSGCTKLAPTALKFFSCKNGSIRRISIINSPQSHVLIYGCNGFKVRNVHIESPGNSPNTDGIHIQSSHNVSIAKTKIKSGDDCVSIGDYTSYVHIRKVECGPGHGISIGSLGRSGNFVRVENIRVANCLFERTTNGARIKTWQAGRGFVRNVKFEKLKFKSVENPIIIDQNYCNVKGACREMTTGVQISNVTFEHFSGTSSSDVAINLSCSRSVPCFGVLMKSIDLKSAETGKLVTAKCSNAFGMEHHVVPASCLQNDL